MKGKNFRNERNRTQKLINLRPSGDYEPVVKMDGSCQDSFVNLALEAFQEKVLKRKTAGLKVQKGGQAVCENQSPKKSLTTLFTIPLFTIQEFNDNLYYNHSFANICQECTSKC